MRREAEIKEQVVAAIAEVLKRKPYNIDERATFEAIGMVLLVLFELILKLEDIFMIEISDEEVEQLDSIPLVISYIKEKVSK